MWMRLERAVAVEEAGPAVDPTEVEEDEEAEVVSSEEAEVEEVREMLLCQCISTSDGFIWCLVDKLSLF